MLGQLTAQFAIVRMPEHAGYRNLLLARLISSLGTWTAFFAVRIALYTTTGSAWWVSVLLFCELVPGVLLGILVGPLIDRWSRRWMMVLSDLGGAVVFAALPFVHSPAGICALSAVAGFASAFFRPGCYSAIPNLVRDDSLVAANALMQGADNLSTLIGPVLAGLGVSLLGSGTVYALNAVSFLVSALLILRIGSGLRSSVPARIGRAHWREVKAGFTLVRRDTHLSSLFLIWSWATLAYTGINVAEIVLTTQAYGVGNLGFGIFVAFMAGGILIGNVLAFWVIDRLSVFGGYRASFLVTAAGVAVCAVSPSYALGCAGAAVVGVGNGIGLVCNMTIIQQVVPDERRGQIFAVLGSLVQTFTLLGTLAAGPLTDALGPRTVWAISALLLVVGFVNAVIVSALRHRHPAAAPADPAATPEVEAGTRPPAGSLERMASLLEEVDRTRQAERVSGLRVQPKKLRREGQAGV